MTTTAPPRTPRPTRRQWLLWRKPDSAWVWQLTDTGHGTTRLVTRVHAVYTWNHPSQRSWESS